MTAPMPTRDEIGANEVFVQVRSGPDHLGRVQFTAFWLDDYLPPNGVRGQVFNTLLDEYIARCEQDGRKVRRWTPEGGVE